MNINNQCEEIEKGRDWEKKKKERKKELGERSGTIIHIHTHAHIYMNDENIKIISTEKMLKLCPLLQSALRGF